MLPALVLAAFVTLSPGQRQAEFERPEHNTLRACPSAELEVGACRLPAGLSEAQAEAMLAGQDTAWRREGDDVLVVARRNTDQAYLCCSARGRMQRIGRGDLWALRLRVVGLDEAVIDVIVEPGASAPGAYRGPKAPPKPRVAAPLKGRVVEAEINSRYLGERRHISLYLPPGFDRSRRYPVVYLADGQFRGEDPSIVEPLIQDGELPPLVLVMISAGVSAKAPDLRSQEYLTGWNGGTARFLKHEAFLLKEVMPAVEKDFGASSRPEDRLISGYSSGAAWAVAMAARHPEVFPKAAGLSVGWSGLGRTLDQPNKARFFLSAGALEPVFYARTLELADRARRSGHEVTLRTTVSGHTPTIWRPMLLEALTWAFRPA